VRDVISLIGMEIAQGASTSMTLSCSPVGR